MHRIDGGELLDSCTASTKAQTDTKLIYALRDLGQRSAQPGTECSIDIAHRYLDDLRLPVHRVASAPTQAHGIRP